MRIVLVALFTAGVAVVAVDGKQDGKRQLFPPGPRAKDACDIKKTEMAPFCETCQGLLDEAGVKQHKTEKDYKGHEIGKAKACVKEYYHCETHPENDSYDKGQCCGKDMEKKSSRSRVTWICETCGATTFEEKKCPREDCPKSKLRAECSLQPNFPHTNEKLWRDNKKKDEKK